MIGLNDKNWRSQGDLWRFLLGMNPQNITEPSFARPTLPWYQYDEDLCDRQGRIQEFSKGGAVK